MKLLAIVLVLAGCATPAPPSCPDLPELPAAATLVDLEVHQLTVVRLYGACRAARSATKLEK